MNELINYNNGFTDGIGWHWPIAIYLLLAGISGGAVIVALALRYYKNQSENTAVYKSAALVSCSTILIGMVFLVADLTKPLVFWKILINYNFFFCYVYWCGCNITLYSSYMYTCYLFI